MIFEGEYLNGKRWEGIIYNKKDNLQFQIKNGNGKVKEYSISQYNVTILFEGEYINGEKNGVEKKYGYKDKLLNPYSLPFPFHLFPLKYSPSNSNSSFQ